jgi:hypothetical protein
MGRQKREHRKAVQEGREAPFRNPSPGEKQQAEVDKALDREMKEKFRKKGGK